jgi:hypothetical protein
VKPVNSDEIITITMVRNGGWTARITLKK